MTLNPTDPMKICQAPKGRGMKKRDKWAFGYKYEKTPNTPNKAPEAPKDGLKLVLLTLLNKAFKMFGYKTLNIEDIINALKYKDK